VNDKINDGGPAFPTTGEGYGYSRYSHNGMTLRDWFAGQALTGLMANPHANIEWMEKHAVTSAYNAADAMLAERERRK
jgi:hypothetical protein